MELTHPGATDLSHKGVIDAAHLMILGPLSDVDQIMEEIFMKFAKDSGMSECILMAIAFFHLIL